MSAAASRYSPTYNLLRGSRLFSLPQPLPATWVNASSQHVAHSETATPPYPTHAALETTTEGLEKGEWGLKRPLPLKSTTKTGTPYIRIKDGIDTIEHIVNFEAAADHVLTLKKFQALNIPVLQPDAAGRTAEPGGLHSTPFEEVYHASDKPSAEALAKGAKRWRTEGPWIPQMSNAEFDWWLTGGTKHMGVSRKKTKAFRTFQRRLLRTMIAELVQAEVARTDSSAEREAPVHESASSWTILQERVRTLAANYASKTSPEGRILLSSDKPSLEGITNSLLELVDSNDIENTLEALLKTSTLVETVRKSANSSEKSAIDFDGISKSLWQKYQFITGVVVRHLGKTGKSVSDNPKAEQLVRTAFDRYSKAILDVVRTHPEAQSSESIWQLVSEALAAQKRGDADLREHMDSAFKDYVKSLRASPSKFLPILQDHFDLPDTPHNGVPQEGGMQVWKLGPDDSKQSSILSVIYRENGMPSTHPSAGLGYLRLPSVISNHAVYGPQSQPDPAPARVLKPGAKGVFDKRREARLGVAGFVSDSNASLFDGRDHDNVLRQFVPQPGGGKYPVRPTHAVISHEGHAILKLTSATPDKAIMAGLKKQVDADEYLQRRQNVQSLGGRMPQLDTGYADREKKLTDALSENRRGLNSMLAAQKKDEKDNDMLGMLDDMMSKSSK